MFAQTAETGTPGVALKWPKDCKVAFDIQKNARGRFVCRIKLNDGEFFNLPSAHATEAEAMRTIEAYIAENMSQSETKNELPNLQQQQDPPAR